MIIGTPYNVAALLERTALQPGRDSKPIPIQPSLKFLFFLNP